MTLDDARRARAAAKPIDARLAYDVWNQLIADEELFRALLAGTHRGLAASRDLDEAKLEALDAFAAERGTKWNIENLRFRTALEASESLTSYLPRTMRLLTNGEDGWLQDICFEYMSFYRWQELGHYRFAECERFVGYLRERILKRRRVPDHLETVLAFELGVIRLLKRTATISHWPTRVALDDAALAASQLRRADAVELISLPVDIRDWVERADLSRGTVRDQPVTFLVYVPSLQHVHRIKILGDGPQLVFERFTGERTTGEIATELADEFDLAPDDLFALARGWLAEGVLAT